MNLAFAAPSIVLSRIERREAALWGAAGVAALVLHLAIILIVHAMQPAGADIGSPVAMMIELEAMPSAAVINSEASMSDEVLPDEPEPVENPERAVESEPVAEPVVEEVKQEEVAEPVKEPEPVEDVIPDPFEVQTPDVVVRLPQPRPVREKPRLEKKQVKEPLEKAKPEAKPVEIAQLPVKPLSTEAPATRNQMASAGSSGVTPASWQRQLQSWIERHRREYSASRVGQRRKVTVQVKFTIDAEGHVTSSRVARSSGFPLLDQAALDMLQRASPVPPPPRGFNTASIITMPVDFAPLAR